MKHGKIFMALLVCVLICVCMVSCDEDDHMHTVGEYTIKAMPTETTSGSATYVCNDCKETVTVTIPALSDTSVWTANRTEATHLAAGKIEYSSIYGSIEVEIPKTNNHAYSSEYSLITEPTETKLGSATHTCECGHVETVTVPLLSDSAWKSTIKTPATHMAQGTAEYTSVYGKVTVTLPKLAQHSFGEEYTIVVEPTETTVGSATHVCECGAVETVVLRILTSPEWTKTVVTPATHLSKGVAEYTSKYGKVTVEIPAEAAHVYGETYTITLNPTANSTGVATHACECGHVESVIVPALSDSAWTENIITPATHAASGKAEYTSKYGVITLTLPRIEAHTFGEYTFTVVPTEFKTGTASRSCECGHIEIVTVPSLKDSIWSVSTKKPATHTTTGIAEYSSVFGKVEVVIPVTDAHTYGDKYTIITEPTETETGVATHTCECGETKKVMVPKLTDTSVWTREVTKAPSHDATGIATYSSIYGKVLLTLDKTDDHIYGDEYTLTVNPTETTIGKATHVCSCGHVETVDVPTLIDPVWEKRVLTITTHLETGLARYTSIYGTLEVVIPKTPNHTYGSNYTVTVPPTHTTTGSATHVCACGDVETVTVPAFSDRTVWTIEVLNEADYTQPQRLKCTSIFGTFEVDGDPKLVYPYASKQYTVLEINATEESKINKTSSIDSWASAKFSTDADGNVPAKGNGYPFREDITIELVNKTTGEVTVTSSYNGTYSGYVDMQSGLIVLQRNTNDRYKSVFVLVPMNVSTSAINASAWGTANVPHIAATVSLGEKTYSFYIENGLVLHMGVSIKDDSGNAVAAENAYNSKYVYIYNSKNELIRASGYNGSAQVEVDEYKGTYTSELGTFIIDGIGGVTLSTGNLVGTYEVADNGFYTIDAKFFTDGQLVKYVWLTIDGDTFAASVPTVFFEYTSSTGTLTINEEELNLSVPYTLPVLNNTATHIFRGWKLEGTTDAEILDATIIPTEDSVLVAVWGLRADYNIHSSQTMTSIPEKLVLAHGDILLEKLPELDGVMHNGFRFEGWFKDSAYTQAITELDVVDGTFADIYAKWVFAGMFSFENDKKYPFVYEKYGDTDNYYWHSTNNGVSSSRHTMTINWVDGVVDISLDYWASSESKNYDYIEISTNGTIISGIAEKAGGNLTVDNAISVVVRLDGKDEYLSISYRKDSGVDRYEDTGYVKDLTINGIVITKLASVDPYAGTYTTANGSVELSGDGEIIYRTPAGNAMGNYTVERRVNDIYILAHLGFISGPEYGEFLLNLTDGTATYTKINVDVNYHYNGFGGTDTTVQVNKYSTHTPAIPTADGQVFKGWFTDSTFTTPYDPEVQITEETDIYAKWAAVVTVTYKFENGGANSDQVIVYAAGDTIGELIEAPETFGTLSFAGWFFKNGDEYTTEVGADLVLSTNITVYAKWVKAFAFAGNYFALRENRGLDYNYASVDFVISPTGDLTLSAYALLNPGTYTVSYIDEAAGTLKFSKVGSNSFYYGLYDAATGIILLRPSPSSTEAAFNSNMNLNYSMLGILVPKSYAKSDITAKRLTLDASSNNTFYLVTATKNGVTYGLIGNGTGITNVEFKYTDGNPLNDVSTLSPAVVAFVAHSKTDNSVVARFGVSAIASGVYKWSVVDNSEEYFGAYTATGDKTLVLSGFGKANYGTKTGSYVMEGNVCKLTISDTEYYEFTITSSTRTYVKSIPQVTITFHYDYNGITHGTQTSVQAGKYVNFTINNTPTSTGYMFRGWYTNSECTTKANDVFKPTADITLYAKWDPAVTIKLHYNQTTIADKTITMYYVNDAVTLGAELPTQTIDGKVAMGWYTDAAFTNAWAIGSTVTTNLDLYCKWEAPHAMMGTYSGAEVWGSNNYGSRGSITIDAYGNVTGYKSGTIKNFDPATGEFEFYTNATTVYFGKYCAATKSLTFDCYSNRTAPQNDVFVYANVDVLNGFVFSSVSSNKKFIGKDLNCSKFIYLPNSNGSEVFCFLFDEVVYFDVTFEVDGVAVTIDTFNNLGTDGTTVTVKSASGTVLLTVTVGASTVTLA